MARLRFIKSHGPYKPGDVKENASTSTVHWLVDVYKVAIVEQPSPIKIEPIPIPESEHEPERDLYKYVRKPQRDKMVYGASNKSSKRQE